MKKVIVFMFLMYWFVCLSGVCFGLGISNSRRGGDSHPYVLEHGDTGTVGRLLPKIPQATFIDPIDPTNADWVVSTVAVVKSSEATLVRCGLTSTRWTSATTGTRGCNIDYGEGTENDFSGCTIFMRYYIDPVNAAAMDYTQSSIYFYDDAGDPNKWTMANIPQAPGWNEFSFTASMGTFAGTMTDWATVRRVYIRHHFVASGFYFILDEFSAFPHGRTKGAVIFAFDDGYQSTYLQGIRYLAKYGYKSMFYIAGEKMAETEAARITDSNGALCTWDEIKAAEGCGALIATHCMIEMPQTSKDDVRKWCALQKSYLIKHGYTTGADYLAIPGGQVLWDGALTEQEMMDVSREFFIHIRGTQPWWQNAARGANSNGNDAPQPYLQRDNRWGWGASQNTTAGYTAKIDKAIAEKDVCVMYFHSITAATPLTITEFQAVVDYVNTNIASLEVLTYEDLLR